MSLLSALNRAGALRTLDHALATSLRRLDPSTPDPVLAAELPAGIAPDGQGRVRTDPAMLAAAGGLDGFFIARWRKG